MISFPASNYPDKAQHHCPTTMHKHTAKVTTTAVAMITACRCLAVKEKQSIHYTLCCQIGREALVRHQAAQRGVAATLLSITVLQNHSLCSGGTDKVTQAADNRDRALSC